MMSGQPLEAAAKSIQQLPVMHPGRPVGRDEQLKEVYSALASQQAVLLHGPAGSGKTTLAAALAAAYTQQPGGVLWLNDAHGPLAALLVRVGRAYGLSDVTTSEKPAALTGAVAAALLQHKPFLVLDGVTDAAAATAFIEKCAASLPVLLTAEQPLMGPWTNMPVGTLSKEDSVSLFKQKSGLTDAAHDSAIARIAILLDQQPFALAIAARAMAASKQMPEQYEETLRQTINAARGDATLAALTASYRALNNALQGLLLMLGATFRGEASATLLSKVSGAPIESLQQATNILAQLYLLERFERGGQPYYRLHPIVHAFTQTWLRGSNRLQGLQEKVRDTVLAYARELSARGAASHDALALEMDAMLATAQWASSNGDRDPASQLLMALTQSGDFVKQRGYMHEFLNLRALSVGSASAFPAYGPEPIEEIEDEEEEVLDEAEEDLLAAFSRDLDDDELDEFEEEDEEAENPAMSALFADEDEDDAYADEDEEDYSPLDEEDEEASSLLSPEDQMDDLVGSLFARVKPAPTPPTPTPSLFNLGDEEDEDEEARRHASQVLGLDYADEDEDLDAYADEDDDLDEISEDFMPFRAEAPRSPSTGSLDSGEQLRAALHQARVDRDLPRQAQVLRALGKIQMSQGRENEAIGTYNEALNLYETVDDAAGLLETLERLSSLLVRSGNGSAALLHANRGLELAAVQGDSQMRMRLLGTLGDVRQEQGEVEEAIEAFEEALELARRFQDPINEAPLLHRLGYAYLDQGEPERALSTWQQARDLFRAQGRRAEEGRVLGGMGAANSEMERWSEAIGYLKSALHIAREVGDKHEEALQLSNLAQAQVEGGHLPDALLSYRQALHLAYLSNDREEIVSAIVDLVRLMMRSKRLLKICQLLLVDARQYEPNDRDVRTLLEEVSEKLAAAQSMGTMLADIEGSARDYAANAYALMDQ